MKGKVSDKAAEFLASATDRQVLQAIRLSEVPAHPNTLLIERIEDLLEQAKSGELVGLAYVCQWKGDTVSNGWQLSRMNARRLIGEIEFMKLEMMERTE